jgi:parallel beta-helix repeat protein
MRRSRSVAAGTVLATMALAAALVVPAAGADVLVVSPGQSIQAAIDAAPPGSTVSLTPGTFNENVVIAKNGITLQGAGPSATFLRAPAAPRNTPCDPVEGPGATSAICIIGDVDVATGQVRTPVLNSRVTGLNIDGFSSYGILVIGADGITVDGNVSSNNGAYGVFAIASSRIQFLSNSTNGNVQAGLYIGSSPDANAVVTGNTANGNLGDGILLGVSNDGTVSDNTFSGNCTGIRVVGGPGVGSDWALERNVVDANNRVCPGRSGTGILVLGGHDIVIQGNQANGNQPAGPSSVSGGIRVVSRGSTPPTNVWVVGNTAFNNLPADLVWDQTGTGILFTANQCGTSIPPGLCGS